MNRRNLIQRPISAKNISPVKMLKDKEQLYQECLQLKIALNQKEAQIGRLKTRLQYTNEKKRHQANLSGENFQKYPRHQENPLQHPRGQHVKKLNFAEGKQGYNLEKHKPINNWLKPEDKHEIIASARSQIKDKSDEIEKNISLKKPSKNVNQEKQLLERQKQNNDKSFLNLALEQQQSLIFQNQKLKHQIKNKLKKNEKNEKKEENVQKREKNETNEIKMTFNELKHKNSVEVPSQQQREDLAQIFSHKKQRQQQKVKKTEHFDELNKLKEENLKLMQQNNQLKQKMQGQQKDKLANYIKQAEQLRQKKKKLQEQWEKMQVKPKEGLNIEANIINLLQKSQKEIAASNLLALEGNFQPLGSKITQMQGQLESIRPLIQSINNTLLILNEESKNKGKKNDELQAEELKQKLKIAQQNISSLKAQLCEKQNTIDKLRKNLKSQKMQPILANQPENNQPNLPANTEQKEMSFDKIKELLKHRFRGQQYSRTKFQQEVTNQPWKNKGIEAIRNTLRQPPFRLLSACIETVIDQLFSDAKEDGVQVQKSLFIEKISNLFENFNERDIQAFYGQVTGERKYQRRQFFIKFRQTLQDMGLGHLFTISLQNLSEALKKMDCKEDFIRFTVDQMAVYSEDLEHLEFVNFLINDEENDLDQTSP